MTMKTKRNDIRLLVLILIGIGCNWSGSLFGQNSLATGDVINVPKYTYNNAITGTVDNTRTFSIESFYSFIKTTLGKTTAQLNTDGFYLRWYITDLSDNIISDLTDWTFATSNAGSGYYKYNSGFVYYSKHKESWFSMNEPSDWTSQAVLNTTITKPQTANWNNYKVVCVLTDDMTGMTNNGSDTKGNLTKEPNTFKMKFEFLSQLPNISTLGAAPPSAKTYTTPKIIMDPSTSQVEFDVLTNGNFKLSDFGIDVSDFDHLKDGFYLRWYIQDKSGNMISDLTGWSDKTDQSARYKYPQGFVWYTGTSTDTYQLGNNWYQQRILGLKLEKPAAASWADYNIVCDLSHDMTKIAALGTQGSISTEPDIQARFIFELSIPNITTEGTFIGTPITSVKYVDNFDNAMVQFTLDREAITQYVNESEEEWLKKLYTRWYIVNRATNEKIDISNWVLKNWDESNAFKYPQGLVYFAKHASATINSYNAVTACITPPSGIDWSDNIKVVCLVATNLTGMVYGDAAGGVKTEPNFDMKFEMTLGLISTLPLLHNHRPGGSIYTTDQIKTVNGHDYQKTSEWNYNLYVEPGKTVQMVLPLENIRNALGETTGDDGSDTEPRGYYRWYDYDADGRSNLTSIYSGTTLSSFDWGFACLDYPERYVKKDVAVLNFNAPSDFSGTTRIACDVSDYNDFSITSTGIKEPTINIRYIFNIRPAKDQADEIVSATTPANLSYYENNKRITFNCAADTTHFTLRFENRLPSNYFFYPYTQSSIGEGGSWGTSVLQAKSMVWFVRNKNGQIVYAYSAGTDNAKTARFLLFSKADFPGVGYNEYFEVFGYVSSDVTSAFTASGVNNATTAWNALANKAPIAYNKCKFMPNRPTLTMGEINASYRHRTYDYMTTHYTLAAEVDFDNIDPTGKTFDYTAPTVANNMRQYPDDLDKSNYGFIYPSIKANKRSNDRSYPVDNGHLGNLAPVHGEYGYYKSANHANVSTKQQGYGWYWNRDPGPSDGFYDRTYERTGNKYGYFMYTDAADESRPLESLDINAHLCTGTSIVFVAWIADLTDKTIKPRVMFKFYGVDHQGNETLLHSTMSQRIEDRAVWRQVYAEIVLQEDEVTVDYDHYKVSIDNYCIGTQGADYAIDDLRVYIKSAKVDIVQTAQNCGDGKIKVRMQGEYDKLVNMVDFNGGTSTNLRYRVIDANGTVVWPTGANGYVETEIKSTFNASDPSGHYVEKDGIRYYYIETNVDLELDPQKYYYLSVAYYQTSNNRWVWGVPTDICSIISDPFKVQEEEIVIKDLNDKVVTTYEIGCTETSTVLNNLTATLSVPDNEGDRYFFDTVNFSWYLNGVMSVEMKEALQRLWADYPGLEGNGAAIDWSAVSTSGLLSSADKDLLVANKAHLIINTRELNNITLTEGTNTFTAVALATSVKIKGADVALCDRFLKVNIEVLAIGSPHIYLGFSDADKESGVLRMGLKQLADMKSGKTLLIPVKDYSNGAAIEPPKKASLIEISGKDFLNLMETNDPTFANITLGEAYGIAKMTELRAKKNTTDYNAVFSFSTTGLAAFTAHEGYWYKVKFSFQNDSEAGNSCSNSTIFTIKIVPEYLTFTGTGDNWNNDDNWVRTSQATLYKDKYGQNTDSYADYPLNTYDGLVHQGYAPMKFTKVTVTADAEPLLYALPLDATHKVVDLTGIVGTQAATIDIEYDMLVKELPPAANYTCEKFYGNTCDQIHFKPGAELLNQHLLNYNRAWVDLELVANRWYMLASLLQGVVAGDMYLPLVNRRQETEAFQEINFDNMLALHNRSLMPVYQRSWDKSDSWVYKPDNSKYDAYIATKATWSHVYNDVEVDYSAQGFSIKADKKDGMDKVLFRLPKADGEYRYYKYNEVTGSITSTPNTKTISRANPYRLRTHGTTDGVVAVTLTAHNHGELYLLCNPYMASLDMAQFFAANSGFENKYWLVNASEQKAYVEGALGYIAPMQSFLVKKKTGAAPTNASFAPAMTVAKSANNNVSLTRAFADVPCLMLIAHRDGAQSTATIMEHYDADDAFADHEDAEALFDSNLSELPTIYTIAGQQAVAINQLQQLGTLPLGVYSDSDAPVTVQVQGVEAFGVPIYLYDAQQGTRIELQSGTAFELPGNTAGRYYLMTEELVDTTDEAAVQVYTRDGRAYVEASGDLLLEQITLYDMGGLMQLREVVPQLQLYDVPLPASGIYLLHIVTNQGIIMQKVINTN